MLNDRYWQLIAGKNVLTKCNCEGRPSNGKHHDDNHMEGYFGNFCILGE